jgi:ankyrin repeat protein
MKPSGTRLVLLLQLMACCLLPVSASAATNDLDALLQRGLFEEEGNHNLDTAIADYRSLAAQFDQNRQIAATAVFRLGECYRKLGQTNEAVAQYERILRDFSDQPTLVSLSRQNLAGLGSEPKKANVPAATEAAAVKAAVAAEAEAASLEAELSQLEKRDHDTLRQIIQQNYPNPVLTKLLQDRAEAQQKLVALARDYRTDHPLYVNAKKLLGTIDNQIDEQVNAVLAGLRAKRDAALQTAKALRAQAGAPAYILNATTGVSEAVQAATAEDVEDQEIARLQVMIQNSPDLINSPVSGSTPLVNAARAGRLRVAAFLLEHGADINAKSGGETALHAATRRGDKAMVTFLLNHGVDIEARDGTGGTALHIAAESGFRSVAEVLLDHKADANARDSQSNGQRTPLHRAARQGYVEMVKLLTEHGADVDAKAADGSTPLNDVAGLGNLRAVQALLAAKANPNIGNNRGVTPLSSAAQSGDLRVVEALLAAKADPNAGTLDSPLLSAVYKQNTALAQMLLEHGADPDAKGAVDWKLSYYGTTHYHGATVTPLLLAVLNKQLPMVELLLKFKANPNDAQTDGRPLVFRALSETNILERLLDAGVQVDSKAVISYAGYGRLSTPLQASVLENNSSAVKLLLKHGANSSVRDEFGDTPLHLAALSGADRAIFELLLEHHAAVNVRDDAGKTPLDLLKEKATPTASLELGGKTSVFQVADLLRRHGALDNLPHWDRIEVSRPGAHFSTTIFHAETNDWNQFTLLQALLVFYDSGRAYSVPQANRSLLIVYSGGQALPFPDLSQVTIVRPAQGTTNLTRLTINLLNATNGIDCSKDVPLQFGDTVEIPERDHSLAEQQGGLTPVQVEALRSHFRLAVQLKVRNQTVELHPNIYNSRIELALKSQEARSVLLASSDLSRVKVIRRDPRTGKTREWLLDCRPQPQPSPQVVQTRLPGSGNFETASAHWSPDFWLRDGDVIEVPEK